MLCLYLQKKYARKPKFKEACRWEACLRRDAKNEPKVTLKGLHIAKMKMSSEGHDPHWTSGFLQIAPKRCFEALT